VTYPSPGGNSGTMRGYLVQPSAQGPFPAVLVIHENRGLNPYIEDVARRVATEGFLALAPDGLSPAGGYPGNDDDGRTLQAGLDQSKLRTDMVNSARLLKAHALSTGKLGVTGFCWGGSTTNFLAVTLGADLHAAVPFYGAAAETARVTEIKAPLLIQSAEGDERINALWPAYEAALKASGARYEMHMYPGTQHGFHNNSTPRYNEAAAKLAWERTIAFFKKHLAWGLAGPHRRPARLHLDELLGHDAEADFPLPASIVSSSYPLWVRAAPRIGHQSALVKGRRARVRFLAPDPYPASRRPLMDVSRR